MFLNRFLPQIGASSLALYNNPGSTVPKRSGTLYFLPTFSKFPADMESSISKRWTCEMPLSVYIHTLRIWGNQEKKKQYGQSF